MPAIGPAAKYDAAVTGRSLIAGVDAKGDPALAFRTENPTTGEPTPTTYHAATAADVASAAQAASEAFAAVAEHPPRERADFLDAVAVKIAALDTTLITLASQETGLAPPRLTSERDRTANQLR